MWIARNARPDILYAVIYLSQFCNAYYDGHYMALRLILKYLIDSKKKSLTLKTPQYDEILKVDAYADSDWAGDPETERVILVA